MFILHLGEIAFVHTTTYTGSNSKYVVNTWASSSSLSIRELLSSAYIEWAWED